MHTIKVKCNLFFQEGKGKFRNIKISSVFIAPVAKWTLPSAEMQTLGTIG